MIRVYKILPLFLLWCQILSAQRIEASKFGYNPNDATECLLKAFSSKYDTIVITKQIADWKVAPLSVKNISNKTIIFKKGVVLVALPGKFGDENACLLELDNARDISVLGYGATFKMNKKEYLDGEWRHALSLMQCENITIKGLVIRDSGGDGVYIAGRDKGTFSENIHIEDIRSINNKRQGMSIISAQNVLVRNCEFTETGGTLPEAGLDIEPNNSKDRIVNINFEQCSFTNNNHSGILVALGKLDAGSLPVTISFTDCYLSNNHVQSNKYPSAEININANKNNPVGGSVLFEDCLIENSNWRMLYSRKRSDAFTVTFKNCAAINICKNKKYPPIGFEVPDYRTIFSSLGGFTFNNLYIQYSNTNPIIEIRGSRLGTLEHVKDISGGITVKNRFLDPLEQIKYINYNPELNVKVDLKISSVGEGL